MTRRRPEIAIGFLLLATSVVGFGCHRGPTSSAAPSASSAPSAAAPAPTSPAAANPSRVVVQVTAEGFVPDKIQAQAGKPITLAITRKTDRTCARELLIKGVDGKTELPLNREVEITYTPTEAGLVPFGCAMGMMVSGSFDVH